VSAVPLVPLDQGSGTILSVENQDEIAPGVDFALLADAVQVLQGKLYVLGGGWNSLFVGSFPARHPSLGVGLRVRVPWSWTEQPLKIGIDLQDEDGARMLPGPAISQIVKVSRSAGMPEGSDVVLARSFTFNNLVFPKPGSFSFVISLDDVPADRLRFTVLERPA
jgi:hypothetical protein